MRGYEHPIFSRVYRFIDWVGEHAGQGEHRARALRQARGRLLIVGLGPGHDLEHVPPQVTSVVAVEPSGAMRHAAQTRVEHLRARGVDVEVIEAIAEELPLADDSVDSVLFAHVLCSVRDVAAALRETIRVARPGASIGILEHVAADDGTWTRRLQRAAAPVWPHIAGGCHPDRDTRSSLAEAGFDVAGLDDMTMEAIPVVAPMIIGTAVRAD
jgi:ubiquinone/menaquinone biosynthesis C-methylase UbiE